MLPAEKMELAIYKHVNALERARSVSISDLNRVLGGNSSFNLIVERLKDLYSHGRIIMYKYGGGSIPVPYDRFIGVEGENEFYAGSFVIEIAPEGRKYFQELEAREKKEQQAAVVFISCGQVTEEERALGKAIATAVEKQFKCKGYFAEDQNSLESLSRHIFSALDQCAGFVAVMHHRGEVHGLKDAIHTRASVWIEQEVAIAAFLTQVHGKTFPIAFYIQRGIKREGVREQLRIDAIPFDKESEVLEDFTRRLANGQFIPSLLE